MDTVVKKWTLWVDVVVGWLLILATVMFITVAVPHLQRQALANDQGVPAGTEWSALGQIWGGDITALTSSADGRLYAGTATGVILRSLDNGVTWTPLCRTASGSSVTALAATSGPITLMIRAVEHEGIQVSYNDGTSWQQSGRGFGDDTVVALVQSGDGTTMYAATANRGVYVSRDGGRHWRAANAGLPTLKITSLLLAPAGDGRLFAGTYGQGVFIADAADLTWTGGDGLPPTASVTALAQNMSRPDILAAVIKDAGIYVSDDAGLTWTAAANLPARSGTVSAATIVARPSWQLIVATDTGNVFAATEPAKGWLEVPLPVRGLAVQALCYGTNATLFAGTSGGVFKADTASWGWVDASTGIQASEITCVVPDPTDASRLYVGTTGGMYVSHDAGATWRRTATELDSQDITVILAGTPVLAGTRGAGLWVSSDGTRWHRVAAKALKDDVLALAPCTGSPGTILAGTSFGVWRVEIESDTATESNLGLYRQRTPMQRGYVEVRAFSVDPADELHVFVVVVGDGLWESVNGGGLWKKVQLMERPMLGSTSDLDWLSSLLVESASRVYVGSTARGIWTGAPGSTWTSFNKGLSRIGIYCGSVRALAKDGTGRLFAGTSMGGIFVLLPGETRWLRMNLGLSSLEGQVLTVNSDLETLYCAMNGTVYVCRIP